MEITKWFPRESMSLFDRESGSFDPMLWGSRSFDGGTFYPATESFVKDDELHLRAEIPGIDPKDIHVTVDGTHLCISGERRIPDEEKDACLCFEEMRYGSFERCFHIPKGVSGDGIKATDRNGILDITIPLPESIKGREIPIT